MRVKKFVEMVRTHYSACTGTKFMLVFLPCPGLPDRAASQQTQMKASEEESMMIPH